MIGIEKSLEKESKNIEAFIQNLPKIESLRAKMLSMQTEFKNLILQA